VSIFLNNNFGFNKNIDNKVSEGKPAISGKISNLPDYIAALKEGSVFKGEVLDVRNNAVKILLSGNNILNARTQAGVSLNIGDILNFKVESNTLRIVVNKRDIALTAMTARTILCFEKIG